MKLCASSQFPFVCLGDCGEVVTGSTPPKANSDFWGGEIPFVTPAQLGFQPPITTADEYVTSEGADRGRLLPEGAVLVCCIGSLGKTGTAGVPLISNQQINAIIFDPIQVDARYGYHAACSLTPLLKHFAPSTTVKIVKKSAFAEFQIPLPPLDEQQRIAGILDAADALRAKRREALAQLDTFLQSTFIDLFGDPVTNPMGWEMVNGGRVSRRLTVGIVVKPACYYQPTGVPAIRSLNVRTNKIEIASLVYVSAENNEGRLKKTRVWKDDVLLVRSGQPGTAAVVPAELDGVNAIDILILTPDQHVAHPVYLSNYFNSAGGKRMVLRAQRGQIQKHLNVGSLRSAPIPLPPLDLQRRFATIVESVEQQRARQRAHLAELDTLFASLQSRAFRGDL